MKSKAEIVVDLRQIIASFEDRETSNDINEHTMFFADLGFMSIDAVLLGEKLQEFYDQSIPFPAFLGSLAAENVTDIEVGQLAEFLSAHVK